MRILVVGFAVAFVIAGAHDEPRGGGNGFCRCWQEEELRTDYVKPYVKSCSNDEDYDAICAEFDRLCQPTTARQLGKRDVDVYGALSLWLKNNRKSAPHNPFTTGYFGEQADAVLLTRSPSTKLTVLDYGCGGGEMLSTLRKRGFAPGQLHCIEVSDYVAHKEDMQVHILGDPIADLQALAGGKLHALFDVASSFSVFHHIPSAPAYRNAFASIFSMLKPGGIFLLNDWDSRGLPDVAMWFDVAHILLWMFMGSNPPTSDSGLELATRYDGTAGWAQLANEVGFLSIETNSTASSHANPLGGFASIFKVPVAGSGSNSGSSSLFRSVQQSASRASQRINTSSLRKRRPAVAPVLQPEPHFNSIRIR